MKNIEDLTAQQLLDTPISQLNLSLPSKYREVIKVLYALLKEKNITWRPHFWLSDEWYVPDGIDGFAIPFTLAHPKLIQLEKKYLGLSEGSSKREFFKLCCHETGHAIDNAYHLRKSKKRQRLFGLSSTRYPKSYVPTIDTENYVSHLKEYYAQAHPEEDWAETFAVWLSQRNWQKKYKHLPALEKLICVSELMQKVSHLPGRKKNKSQTLHYKDDHRTVREYLIQKRTESRGNKFSFSKPSYFARTNSAQNSAYAFMKKNKKQILAKTKTTPQNPWFLERCFEDLAGECREEKLGASNLKPQLFAQIIDANMDEYIGQGHPQIIM